MGREDYISRRQVLVSGFTGIAVGFAGCVSEISDNNEEDADQGESPAGDVPVVDNGSSDADKNVTIDVEVLGEDGEPASGIEVKLEDRGGTPDNRFGKTGSEGRLRFVESVGPPPCNSLTLLVPEEGLVADLGCHNGDTDLEHTFEVGADESEPPAEVDYPVVDNGNSNSEKNVVIDLTVVDDSGDPVSGIGVKLFDRGGTPDNRSGQTGSAGRLRFIEGVGPPPCNSLSVAVPETDTSMSLGCHNGYKEIQQRLVVER